MRGVFCIFVILLVAGFVGGCDQTEIIGSLMGDGGGDDGTFPEIRHWHTYDQDVLRISWDVVQGAQGYVVFLQEDYGIPIGSRREIFHQIFVDADDEPVTLFMRNDEYFLDMTPGQSKCFVVNILPVSGKIPDHNDFDFHPDDYSSLLVGDPVRTSFFWHQRSGEIDRLRQAFSVSEGPNLLTLEHVHWNIIPVSRVDEIVFNPPPASDVLLDMRYEVSAYHLGAVVYTNIHHGVGTGRSVHWGELSITLPYSVVADTVKIRAVWEIGGEDNVVGEWSEVSRE